MRNESSLFDVNFLIALVAAAARAPRSRSCLVPKELGCGLGELSVDPELLGFFRVMSEAKYQRDRLSTKENHWSW